MNEYKITTWPFILAPRIFQKPFEEHIKSGKPTWLAIIEHNSDNPNGVPDWLTTKEFGPNGYVKFTLNDDRVLIVGFDKVEQ